MRARFDAAAARAELDAGRGPRYVAAVQSARLPKAFWSYVLLTGALGGLAALEGSHVVISGAVLETFLIVQMARRRNWAWAILMLLNTVPLLAVAISLFSSTTTSANGHLVSVERFSGFNIRSIALFLLVAGAEWCLWSRSLRRHIDSRHPPRQPRPSIRPRMGRS